MNMIKFLEKYCEIAKNVISIQPADWIFKNGKDKIPNTDAKIIVKVLIGIKKLSGLIIKLNAKSVNPDNTIFFTTFKILFINIFS